MEYPITQTNPNDAEKYGVEDGDWIWIKSPRGRIRQRARVYPGMKEGVIMTTGNWFYPEEPAKGYHGV